MWFSEHFVQGFIWGIGIAATRCTEKHAAAANCAYEGLKGHTMSNKFLQKKTSVLNDKRSKHGLMSLHTVQVPRVQSAFPRHEIQPTVRVCLAQLLI